MNKSSPRALALNVARRAGCVLIAWIMGFTTYMVAMMVTVYDGITSLILQPIMGAIITTITVGACLIVGLVFHIPKVGRIWRALWPLAPVLALGSVVLMCFGSSWGMTTTFNDPDTRQQMTGLQPAVGISAYLVMIFVITNWPLSFKFPEAHPPTPETAA